MADNGAELLLVTHMRELGLTLESEYRFVTQRKWRFDLAEPQLMLAIEIEGGIWTNGRHTRGKGYQGDLDKYNTAASLGWTVFRFSVPDVLQGTAKEFIERWLRQ